MIVPITYTPEYAEKPPLIGRTIPVTNFDAGDNNQ
jgi:hypothetical protein